MPADSRLLVARIGKPHGLRGEVTVQTHTDDPEARFAPGVVYATEAAPGSGVPRSLTLRTARLHQKVWLLGFEEIPDRTGAESLRGTRLVVDAADVHPAADETTSSPRSSCAAWPSSTPRARCWARSAGSSSAPPRTAW